MSLVPLLTPGGRPLRVLMIQPALASYRIDLLNSLGQICNFKVIFLRDHISYHVSMRQDELQRQLTCNFAVLRSNIVIRQRDIPVGLFGMILSHRPDVLITHEYAAASAIGALACPLLLRCGLVIWSVANWGETRRHRMPQSALRRLMATWADALVFYSRRGAQTFAEKFGLSEANMFVCANHQMEHRLRSLMDKGRPAVWRELGQLGFGASRVLLYVGRLAPEKRVDVALCAFGRATKEFPDLTFVIVGDGPEESALRQAAFELGIANRVVFVGHQQGPTLYGWYAAASLLVLPSAFEPYGAVVAEALSLGVPVICSRVAGASELVIGGQNGWLCEPESDSVYRCLRKSAPEWRLASELMTLVRPSRCGNLFTHAVAGFSAALMYAAKTHRDDDAV